MQNPFLDRTLTLDGPATDLLPITPSDTAPLSYVAIALYIEGAGDLVIETVAGQTRTVAVAAHATVALGVKRVFATGTTATGIHALVLAPVDAAPPALANTELPVITGVPEIGQTLNSSQGTWTGGTAPVFSFQWMRDAVAISGETSPAYTLTAADDVTTVTCRVTGTDGATVVEADAVGVAVTYAAPSATNGIPDQSFTENTGLQTVDTAPDFTGSALVFSLTSAPAGVTLDGAGVLTIDTDATGELASVPVVVRATNSGGFAETTVLVTVTAVALEAETQAFGTNHASYGGAPLTMGETTTLNDFFVAAKASTWWPKIHRLYVGGLHDEVAGKIDLRDQTTQMSQSGTNDMVWTAGQGWSADNVDGAGLDMQVDPSAVADQNSVALILWYHGLSADFGPDMTDDNQFYVRFLDSGNARARLFCSSNANASGLDTSAGFRLVNRTGVNPIEIYGSAGTLIETLMRSSETPVSGALHLGAANGAGPTSDRYVLVNGIADQLTSDEALSLRNALAALLAGFQSTSAPLNLMPPSTSGEGNVGNTMSASSGSWTGTNLAFAYRWLRDGVAIPGATSETYLLTGDDDGRAVSVEVTATADEGTATATSEAVAIAYAPPLASAALPDRAFVVGTGAQIFETAGDFTGEALSFALLNAQGGVSIDAETGVITIDTEATGTLSDVVLVVEAYNSGGQAASGFALSVSTLPASDYAEPGGLEPTLIVDAAGGIYRLGAEGSSEVHRLAGNSGAQRDTDMAPVIDADGNLKWPLHNLYPGGAGPAEDHNVPVDPAGRYTIGFKGSGTLSLSGAATANVAGAGAETLVTMPLQPSAQVLSCTASGDVRDVRLFRSDLGGMQTHGGSDPTYLPAPEGACFTLGIQHDEETGGVLGHPVWPARTNLCETADPLTFYGQEENWRDNHAGFAPASVNALGAFQGLRVISEGSVWNRAEKVFGPFVAGKDYAITVVYHLGSAAEQRFSIKDGSQQTQVGGAFGSKVVLDANAGTARDISETITLDGSRILRFVWTPNVTRDFILGFGPQTTTAGEDVIFCYCQVEEGSTPGPIIPNLDGVTHTTRSEAACAIPALDWSFNQTEGTVYAEFSAPFAGNQTNAPRVWQLDDGTESSARFVGIAPGPGTLSAESAAAGLNQVDGLNVGYIGGAPATSVFAFRANDFALSVNGGPAMSDTNGDLGLALDTLRIGSASIGGHELGGYLTRLAIYPQQLSAAAIETLSGAGLPQLSIAPSLVADPAISGSNVVGATLSVSNGTWDGAGISFQYQWNRDGSDIGGASEPSYTTSSDDVGYEIKCVVTASNTFGTGSATATGAITVVDTPAPLAGLNYHPAKAATSADQLAGYLAPGGWGDTLNGASIDYLSTLDWDNGPGSMKQLAGRSANGKWSFVIPTVGGTVSVASSHGTLSRDLTWYAFEAGPGQGVEFVGNELRVTSSNTMLGHGKFRPGPSSDPDDTDGLNVRAGSGDVMNVKFYNCSIQGSNDESIGIDAQGDYITHLSFVDCLLGYPMNNRNDHIFGPYFLDGAYKSEFVRSMLVGFRRRSFGVEVGSIPGAWGCLIVSATEGYVTSRPIHFIGTNSKVLPNGHVYEYGADADGCVAIWLPSDPSDGNFIQTIDSAPGVSLDRPVQIYRGSNAVVPSWTTPITSFEPGDPSASSKSYVDERTTPSYPSVHAFWTGEDTRANVPNYVGARPANRDGLDQQLIADALALNLGFRTSLPAYSLPQTSGGFTPVANPFELVNGVPRIVWQIHDDYHVPNGGIPYL